MSFKVAWQGSKNPKTVTLPNGQVETVNYMRDGICLFQSSRSATYERTGDYEAEFTMIEGLEQAKEAVANYQAAQPNVQADEPKGDAPKGDEWDSSAYSSFFDDGLSARQ